MRLDNKRVVIIGGSSGIGLETARLALADGARVTIAGRSEDRLRRAADRVLSGRDRLRTVVADLSEESSIRSLFSGEGHVDHVFVPAGEFRPGDGDLLKSDLDGLRSILQVRLLGVTHVVRQARPKDGGWFDHADVRPLRDAPGPGRRDGGGRRRCRAGDDPGSGAGSGPDPGQPRGHTASRTIWDKIGFLSLTFRQPALNVAV